MAPMTSVCAREKHINSLDPQNCISLELKFFWIAVNRWIERRATHHVQQKLTSKNMNTKFKHDRNRPLVVPSPNVDIDENP